MNPNEIEDTGSCVQAPVPTTPEEVNNRPGLSAIRYRIGSYNSFREEMIKQIGSYRLKAKETPNLQGWTSRDSDDYGIALMEMWAYLADILTFYQERIANEAYLRTATLPESVRRLAAFLDYKPSPGVAASVLLAFTAEKDKSVQIPVKLKVQSVPGENEKPQKFETIETVNAEFRLNQIKVLPEPQPTNPFSGSSAALDPGADAQTVSQLAPGDKFVIFSEDGYVEEKEIKSLLQAEEGLTRINWEPPMQPISLKNPRAFKFLRKLRLFGYNAPSCYLKSDIDKNGSIVWKNVQSDFSVFQGSQLNLDSIYDDVKRGTEILVKVDGLYAFTWKEDNERLIDFLKHRFCINWPTKDGIKENGIDNIIEMKSDQKSLTLKLSDNNTEVTLWIDGVITAKFIAKIEDNKRNIYTNPNFAVLTEITNTHLSAVTLGPLSATVTAVDIKPPINDICDLRMAEIYILGPEIKFWKKTYPDEISGDNFYIDIKALDKIEPQRTILLDDKSYEPQQAIITSSTNVDLEGDGKQEYLKVHFSPSLARSLDTKSAKLWGNVARATHGETIDGEVLGNGDASMTFQSFTLSKDHVTFIPQEGSLHGAANSLKVYVDGIEWKEVMSFVGHGEKERLYKTEIDDNSKMIVQFGDGIRCARPASGSGNITATYRQGLGKCGNVGAGKLKTLLDKPLGLKSVENPGEASGGADPESKDSVKKNAPNTVRTFDRIISLKDFEDAAREFTGIAKARSSWSWDGEEQAVDLVVACDDNIDLSPDVKPRLISYLNYRRDTNLKLNVRNRKKRYVVIEAAIKVDPSRIKEEVKSRVIESLKNHFSFDNMVLGLPVHLSEVYRVIQGVDGVNAALISKLQFKNSQRKADYVQEHLDVGPGELITIEDSLNDVVVNFGVIS